jgi:LuxR family transcriptional regulator, maltose regulon positive regulatory protein
MGIRKGVSRLAKLNLPRLHNALRRERLFALLDTRNHQAAFWVGAPAGSGKTTLVASYLEARKIPTLWFQVDEGDRDLATFFHYLGELARSAERKIALPQFSTEYQDVAAFARHYFRAFYRCLKPGMALAVDNCQDAASEGFHQILRAACDELPPQTNLIAISRSLAPGEFSRLCAHGTVKQIGWSELRLTTDEALALGGAMGERDASKVGDAYRLSDGWATGIKLALTHAQSHAGAGTARFNTREALFSYLLTEMLARTPAEARTVLTRCALFPQITVALAQEFSGVARAGDILEELYRNQYLIDRKAEGELTYQFHDLLREFLLSELEKATPTDELATLRKRAAALLECARQINDAVQLLRQAGDWNEVVRAIKAHAESLLDNGRWQTLHDWFDGMPESVFSSDAWLLYWRGRALMLPDTRRAKALLEVAYERFAAMGDDDGVIAVATPLCDVVFLLGAPLTQFPEWMRALAGPLARAKRFLSPQIGIEAWGSYIVMGVFGRAESPMLESALDFIKQALVREEEAPSGAQSLGVGLGLAQFAWFAADVELSERVSRILHICVRRSDLNLIYQHWAYYWVALPDWCMGRNREAIKFFNEAIGMVTRFRFAAAENTAYCYLSKSYQHLGMTDEAEATLRNARPVFDSSRSFQWGTYNDALAFGHYQRGDLEQAITHQNICTQALDAAGSLGMLAFAWPSEAAYYAQSGRVDEAVATVTKARAATAKTIHRLSDAAYCFALAEVELHSANESEALQHLREGLREARNPIKAGMLYSLTRCLPRLLSLALAHDIEPDVVRTLIARWNLLPNVSLQDRWPWPVKIYALGGFRVEIAGDALPAKSKAHFKVLALLKAIIAAGARDVSAATLAEWLWPDAEGDAAAISLRVGLHRLRKLLGREDAVILHDNKVSLNDRVCWLDVWAFDVELDSMGGEYQPDSNLGSSSQTDTINLYRGHLLPQDDLPWLLAARERLHAKFARVALAAGKRYEAAQEFDAAARLYERCLEIDASAEALHRHLMLCLKHAGRYTEALDAFQRCERALERKLSRETQQVYESLLRL